MDNVWRSLAQGLTAGVEQFAAALMIVLLVGLFMYLGWKLALRMIERMAVRAGKKIVSIPQQVVRGAGAAAGSALSTASTIASDAKTAAGPLVRDAAAKGASVAAAGADMVRVGVGKAVPFAQDAALATLVAAKGGAHFAADAIVAAAPAVQLAAGALKTSAANSASSVIGKIRATDSSPTPDVMDSGEQASKQAGETRKA